MPLNPADPDFLSALAARLPKDTLRAPEPRYLEEPRGRATGLAGAIALPRRVQEVSIIVKACNDHGVPLIPFGGGTGLVGGQLSDALPAPLVMSLERMNRVRSVNAQSNVIEVDAGCILADVHAAAEGAGRLFPLSLAAKGSAQIGGNLSTNAGGVNVLRYGNARDLCLGLEAVLPNGDIWQGLSPLRKDNTGYDLRNLLIGAEGTLGVITAASLKLFPQPFAHETALLVVPSPEAALDLLAMAQDMVGEAVSAFELMSRQALDFLAETMPEVRSPFTNHPDWFVLLDFGLSRAQAGNAAMETLFEAALKNGLVSDGFIASSSQQREDFWTLRESIPLANRAIGSISSHDVSLPLDCLPVFIEQGQKLVEGFGGLRLNCFGHLGDGNLHFNAFPQKGRNKSEFSHLSAEIKSAVHDLVAQFGGSFSAEHGVGRLKTGDLLKYADPTKIAAMKAIKAALDPNGIMNPGAVLEV
ncbi:FAD-binding oxidoreductase [Cognatishimia maritima]|uniref:FAD/FMN-containing dehydrogenase n=1 Tax=Cognatishimia maritima TaxID=870908 RepID=A0A1M5VDM9_9RHOB|nr:FAD-binding oxidoreductase [Cognatishimia maritima]SHH73359.1 FAD/FMN-containing dehydrogenase [Cognatishimia maritima]